MPGPSKMLDGFQCAASTMYQRDARNRLKKSRDGTQKSVNHNAVYTAHIANVISGSVVLELTAGTGPSLPPGTAEQEPFISLSTRSMSGSPENGSIYIARLI